MNFNQCILVISADIDEKRLVLFEHTINRVFSCYVRLLQLEYYRTFSFFFFSLKSLFSFPSQATYIETDEGTVFKLWAIEHIKEN